MRRFAPGDRFEFSLGGDQVKAFGSDIAIYYGDLTPEASHSVQRAKANRNEQPPVDLVYTTSSLGPERDFSGVDLVTPEMEESVHAIAVKSGGRSIRLETGSLGKPFAAMRQCTAALVASWGLDERVQAGRLRQLRPLGQTQWAPEIQKIYPLELAAKGMQARVNVRILVDTDGKPTTAKFFVLTTTHSLTKSLATR
ncbi:hypothetical protein ASE49_11620 [Novosphingobium sp. Leaf2]|nr:hypothetical protein ASE49_11620 [Novosphingobium sp. Leaf2]